MSSSLPAAAPEGPSVSRRESVLAGLALAVLFLIAHAHALPPGRVLAASDIALATRPFVVERGILERPKNPALWDQALQFAPWFAFDAREVSGGRLPLWNPHAGCGEAHAGNDQVALFHPVRLVALLLGPAAGLFLLAFARHVLGGLGLYLFLRQLGLGFAAGLAGAVVFAFSGFLVVWQGSPHSAVAAVLGWALLGVERAARQPGTRPSALVALATAFALWGGHAETALHVGLATGGLALGHAVAAGRRGGARAVLELAARLAGGVALGLGLAAPHVLSFAAELGESEALARRTGASVQWSLPARFLALIPFPDLYGNPRDGTAPANPVQSYLELAGAGTGAAAVALALVGAFGSWDQRATRVATAALVAGAIALALAMGLPGFAALEAVPPLSLARNQRLVLIAVAAVAVAAAAGVELVQTRRARVGRAALGVAVVVGLALWARASFGDEVAHAVADERGRAFRGGVFALVGPLLAAVAALAVAGSCSLGGLSRSATGGLLVLVLALEQAVVFAGGWNPAVARADFYPASPTVEALREAAPGDRARTLVLGDLLVLPPDVATAYGLDVVGRYDALGSRTFAPLRDALGPVPPREVAECFQRIDPRIARILAVRRIVVGQAELDPRLAWTDLVPVPDRAHAELVSSSRALTERFVAPVPELSGVRVEALLSEFPPGMSPRVVLELKVLENGAIARVASSVVVPRRGGATPVIFSFEPIPSAAGRSFEATLRRTDPGPGVALLARTEGARPEAASVGPDGRGLAGALVFSVASPGARAGDYHELPGLGVPVLEDSGALPRARVVGRAERARTSEEGVARLRDPAHDPRESVVLLESESSPDSVAPVASAARGTASLEIYLPDEVVVRASAPAGGGWLVLADAWHPGWSAAVDGQEARVLKADVALRAVRLAAGEHTVVFRFRPPGLAPGLVLAALALAALVSAHLRRVVAS